MILCNYKNGSWVVELVETTCNNSIVCLRQAQAPIHGWLSSFTELVEECQKNTSYNSKVCLRQAQAPIHGWLTLRHELSRTLVETTADFQLTMPGFARACTRLCLGT